jgi:hypothetical protein
MIERSIHTTGSRNCVVWRRKTASSAAMRLKFGLQLVADSSGLGLLPRERVAASSISRRRAL